LSVRFFIILVEGDWGWSLWVVVGSQERDRSVRARADLGTGLDIGLPRLSSDSQIRPVVDIKRPDSLTYWSHSALTPSLLYLEQVELS
jgi:hypothetical protein